MKRVRSRKRKVLYAFLAAIGIWFTIGMINLVITEIKRANAPAPKAQAQTYAKLPEPSTITANTLFLEINKVRVKNGLQPFSHNPKLDQSSTLKCDDMVKYNYWGHDNPTTGKQGGSYMKDIPGLYYDAGSENLSVGFFNRPEQVIAGWMDSPDHAASILDPQFTEIGFAVCMKKGEVLDDQVMVVQHKINPWEQPAQQNTSNRLKTHCLHYDTSSSSSQTICN